MHKHILSFCLVLCFTMPSLMQGADVPEVPLEWETFTFTFPVKVKEGMEDKTIKIQLPKKEQATPIRGIMSSDIKPNSFMPVAHKHNLAVVNEYDGGKGPSSKFLIAAAEACKRPEIEFAGAVSIGCSAFGRKAAQWAAFNHERSLAVFLDHSSAGAVDAKPSNDYGNLPIVPGVPMCFTNTHDDLFQGNDRRDMHYRWCTTAFRDYQQPCSTSIYFEKSGHCKVLSRELQAVWLDEVLALRIPATIPVGQPYKLIPVTIQSGGMIKADLAKDEAGRTYHDNVIIGPSEKVTKYKEMNFWTPGPRTAAIYIDWIGKNGGKVLVNNGAQIKEPGVVKGKKK